MKILLVTPYLFPEGGGLERYADALATHLTRHGHDVTQLGFSEEPRYEYERGFRRIHVPYAFRVSNTPVGFNVLREARKLLRHERFDIVNAHTPVPGAAESAAWAAWRARVPYVVTYHAGRLAGGSAALDAVASLHHATLERLMLRGAAARIAVSPYVQSHALEGRAASVVAPGVDVERFRECAKPEPGRILFVGPVSTSYAWKGFATLFDAFVQLARRVPHAHLRVVGRGDLQQAYEERARSLGLEKRVTFAGRVEEDALPREYSEAQVAVLPSTSDAESFGMVLAEANACGRAVIGSRVGGIPHFVQQGANGLLVEPGDAADLADALQRVIEDETLARELGRRGAERVRSAHRWEALAARTAAVYQTAAAQQARRRGRGLARRTPALRG